MSTTTQPWLGSRWTEIVFILLPPFFSLLLVILFPSVFQQQQQGLSDAWWVILILLVDVAHVYSTLYRTYFDKAAFTEKRNILLLVPFIAFVVLVMLYTQSPLWFWRILAYTAVYHFIRQQYGFMRIYSRKEKQSRFKRNIDAVTIYAATIYPILFWHLQSDRNFNWFIDGDFFDLAFAGNLLLVFSFVYYLILILYCVKEMIVSFRQSAFNFPKNAVILGTILSWYFGIVYFNGDMAFTLLNVVSHGIPYMALIWIYGMKSISATHQVSQFTRLVFSKYGLLLFLAIIFFFAFLEEGLWDMTLWKEHTGVFQLFHIESFTFDKSLLNFIVPLLALPQVTHYIVDGFIWRIRKNDLRWSEGGKAETQPIN